MSRLKGLKHLHSGVLSCYFLRLNGTVCRRHPYIESTDSMILPFIFTDVTTNDIALFSYKSFIFSGRCMFRDRYAVLNSIEKRAYPQDNVKVASNNNW